MKNVSSAAVARAACFKSRHTQYYKRYLLLPLLQMLCNSSPQGRSVCAKMKTVALLSLLFSIVVFGRDLALVPSDPTETDMPGWHSMVMHYSNYAAPRMPVHLTLTVIGHAQDSLLAMRSRRHEKLDDDIPGGSFTYHDENGIRIEVLPVPPYRIIYVFVENFLDGLALWAKRWTEGPMTVPGTDVTVGYTVMSPFVTGRLERSLLAKNATL